MGAEFVTFNNTVNAIVRIIRRCDLSGCTKNFFLSFLLHADYLPSGLLGRNYGILKAKTMVLNRGANNKAKPKHENNI